MKYLDLEFEQCSGNGLGSCTRCEEKGKWNRAWMSFLYKIKDMDGCYCYECVKDIAIENFQNH